jgi:type IV pilus assembly protein PilA
MRHRPAETARTESEPSSQKGEPGVIPWLRLVAAGVLIGLSVSAGAIQSQTARSGVRKPGQASSRAEKPQAGKAQEPDLNWLQEVLKNHELMTELGQLATKLQAGIQYPAARNSSRILPLLPESTALYLAFPNYGEATHQALEIFRQELKNSAQLKDFLQKNKWDAAEPKLENGLEKFSEFSQYLGDEVVFSGRMGDEPVFVAVAEVKKPGVREFLEKLNNEVITSKSDRLRIFDSQQLAAITEKDASSSPVVLVRKDFIVLSSSVPGLREFDAQIDQHNRGFTSTALGQRLARAYQEGANSLLGLDLHTVINLIPQLRAQDRAMLEKTGFADVNYLVARSTLSAATSTNQGEIVFNGPRHGLASWIGAPAPMGGLDFVSARAASAADIILKNPAQIFDDVNEFSGGAVFASLPQMEEQLKVNIKQDVLSKLTGEVAFETRMPAPVITSPDQAPAEQTAAPSPHIKLILRVSDADGLQQVLPRLLTLAPVEIGQRDEDGVTVHTLKSQGPANPPTEINYFFLDGYLVIASDRLTAQDALRAHRSGDSLAKSSKLRDSLPPGQSPNASALMYQDAGQMLTSMMSQLPPEVRELFSGSDPNSTKPSVVRVYADESALRGVTNSSVQADLGLGMIVAAVAIPNLLRSRIAANESVAVSSTRTVNVAQVTYSTEYPNRGFARDLASLGTGATAGCTGNNTNAAHACLLDGALGDASCTTGKWCEKSGYRFSVRATCLQLKCRNYVVTATPASAATGTRSFCSTKDGVIRFSSGAPLETPLTAAECQSWEPLQ